MPLTEEQIARLEALERAATPGEWRVEKGVAVWAPLPAMQGASLVASTHFAESRQTMPNEHADAALIAESRNLLPALIADLRASQAENARLREVLAWYADAEHYETVVVIVPSASYGGPPLQDDSTEVAEDHGARARAALADE